MLTHGEQNDDTRATIASKRHGGLAALDVMEKHLNHHVFFAGERFSIADIGLYAYTHVANEGGFDLTPYPAIENWLQKVSTQPRHCKITDDFSRSENRR